MNKLHLYSLAFALTLLGLALFMYKAVYLGFPVSPNAKTHVWKVEAKLKFETHGKPVKLALFIPSGNEEYAVMDEQFLSGKFGMATSRDNGNRVAIWSARKARGTQRLYYQATIRKMRGTEIHRKIKLPALTPHEFEGPRLEAAKSLMDEMKAKSADASTMAAAVLERLKAGDNDVNVKLLLNSDPSVENRLKVAVRLLAYENVRARVINGVRLKEDKLDFSKKVPLVHWLEVFNEDKWVPFHPVTCDSQIPDEWLTWWKGPRKVAKLEGGDNLNVVVSVSPNIEEGLSSAIRRAQAEKPFLYRFSLFSLPVNTQAVYRVILLAPIGALVLIFLRNVIGIKTFGTFMPVLIGLAFRETGLLRGVLIFSLLVAMGLGIRFYLEKLKLLAVPRLTAVLISVVGIMALLSVITHAMGGNTGLSVALFPMVILAMTIERMSIVWEERGAQEAVISGLGSVLTAGLAFIVMNIQIIGHLVFVFPELLLCALAITLLMGRYTGYRLIDLYRFRELARR